MIDSHCHLEYMPDIIEEAREKMTAIVSSIADPKDAEKIIALHRKHPKFVFACAGFHPERIKKYDDQQIDEYIDFIRQNRDNLIAIGEIGLDHSWLISDDEKEKSKQIFQKFINLAKELDLPLVIHSRNGKEGNAIEDAISILEENNCKRVMMHCFSGSEGQLKRCLQNGWLISFATIIVRSFKHQRLVKLTPLAQMLLETDAPWLDPDAVSGSKELTNRPWKIEKSAEVIAKIKDVSKEDILKATEENAKKFFRLVI